MSKPVLLLLPGLLCDVAVWHKQMDALSTYECVVPDYGMADSIAAMAEVAIAALPAGNFAVAGHSMGGRVALEIARRIPERVARIALLDTGMHPLATGDAGAREVAGRMALLQKARTQGMRAMGQEWARGMVRESCLETPLFEEILAMIERKTPDIFAAQLKALIERPDARDVLAGLAVPVLLSCGRQDNWSPVARHEEMLALCPQARLRVIEDSGHMSTMEQPQAVTQMLRDWLEEGNRASA
ncbi:alpha/beta fold hydrolase [Kerstersia similis]|uniref:alpha/beta fold hydrolase n=1 Tax=Kerstersia similis TaxID=206505 RepID=UPI0039EE3C17